MTNHDLLRFAHIIGLTYWLGADLGQFVLSFTVRKATVPVATRAAMAKVMVALDLGPRICLVLMLPIGLSLAANVAKTPLRGGALAVVWIASLVWLAVVVRLHFAPGKHALARTGDLWLRAGIATTLVGLSAVSLASGEPFAPNWLAAKVGIFGLCVACGLWIRIAIRNFGPALGRLITEGSTPAGEAALEASIRPAYVPVVTIWVLLLAAAGLGVMQP